MHLNYKKICLSILLYAAGTFAQSEAPFGFHGLLLRNRLQAKLAELSKKFLIHNEYQEEKFSYEEKMSFEIKIQEKINQLARKADIAAKQQKEWREKLKQLSPDEIWILAKEDVFFEEYMKFPKGATTVQAEDTFECLETLNNEYILGSLNDSKTLMNEILFCMDAAEKEAQK